MTAVFVDVDGTLLRFSNPYGDVVADALSRVAVGADPDDFAAAYGGAFFEAFEAFDPAPVRSAAAHAFESCGVDGDPRAFADALLAAELDAATVPEGVRDVLDELASDSTRRLGVLTNGVADWQREKLSHCGLFDRFDACVVSYDVGAHKPDSAVFAAAEDALPADEYVYVGDSLDHDVAPARERGWRAVHVGDDGDDFAAVLDVV